MKILILTVGLPRSGKSTWVKQCGLGAATVNPDSIRFALYNQRFIKEMEPLVWFITKIMVKALFTSGHDYVILDATNITIESRQKWSTNNEWKTYYKIINTDKQTCFQRAIKDHRYDLIPIITNMAERFENLNLDEQNRKIETLWNIHNLK